MQQQLRDGEKVDLPLASVVEPEPDAAVANYRRTFQPKPLKELEDSISAVGVLQPVVVRPKGDAFELVCGSRRVRACVNLRRESIPAIVRYLSDDDVLAVRLVENLQRENPHPLEEADGYKRLEAKHTVEEIAAMVAKEVGYVTKRLQLCALAAPARKVYREGRLTDYAAVAVATIPDAALQAQAVEELTQYEDPAEPSLVRRVMVKYRLHLKAAPFPIADEQLLDGAPSCNACPRRTGNQPRLFDDADSGDLCTDLACFKAKCSANWTRLCDEALANGWEVMGEEESAELFGHGNYLVHGAPYVDLAEQYLRDSKRRTWGALLRRFAPPIVLAVDKRGAARQLVRRELAMEMYRARFGGTPEEQQEATRKERDKQTRLEQKKRKAVVDVGLRALAAKASSQGVSDALLRFMASQVFALSDDNTRRKVAEVRGVKERSYYEARNAMDKVFAAMTGPEALGFLVEALAVRWAYSPSASGYGGAFQDACGLFGITVEELESGVSQQQALLDGQRRKKKGAPKSSSTADVEVEEREAA